MVQISCNIAFRVVRGQQLERETEFFFATLVRHVQYCGISRPSSSIVLQDTDKVQEYGLERESLQRQLRQVAERITLAASQQQVEEAASSLTTLENLLQVSKVSPLCLLPNKAVPPSPPFLPHLPNATNPPLFWNPVCPPSADCCTHCQNVTKPAMSSDTPDCLNAGRLPQAGPKKSTDQA